MKKTMYVLRFGNWDPDRVIIADSLEKIADAIRHYCEDELYFPDVKELVQHMKKREKEHYIYLYDKVENVPDYLEISVNEADMWE